MNLYYKMLRLKKLKKNKKMRGGLLGPKSSQQLADATDSYGQWWDKTKAGVNRAELETNIAIGDFKHHHKETRKSFAGSPPTVIPTTSLPPLPPIHKPLTLVQKANNPTGTIIGGKRKTKKRRRKRKKKKTKRKKRRRKRKTKKRRRKKYN